jgi:hypothetical protein
MCVVWREYQGGAKIIASERPNDVCFPARTKAPLVHVATTGFFGHGVEVYKIAPFVPKR